MKYSTIVSIRIQEELSWIERATLLSLSLATSLSASVCMVIGSIAPTYAAGKVPAAASIPAARLPLPEPSGLRWQPGLHYTVLVPSETPNVPEGQVELLELFMYTSGTSMRLRPHLQKWLEKHPEVAYKRLPSIVFPHAREQARMYFTLVEMRREDLHVGLFEWVQDEDRYPVYHTLRYPAKEAILDLNRAYAKLNGLDPKAFLEIYESREISEKVIRQEVGTHGYHVRGTSTLVVNGRYSTSLQRLMALDPAQPERDRVEDYERLLQLIEYLVKTEMKAKS